MAYFIMCWCNHDWDTMSHDQSPRAVRLGANQGSTLHGMLYVARAPAPLLTKIYNQWVPRVAGDILSCLDHHSAGSRPSIHHHHSPANHLSLLDLHLDRHWPPQHSTWHRHETICTALLYCQEYRRWDIICYLRCVPDSSIQIQSVVIFWF